MGTAFFSTMCTDRDISRLHGTSHIGAVMSVKACANRKAGLIACLPVLGSCPRLDNSPAFLNCATGLSQVPQGSSGGVARLVILLQLHLIVGSHMEVLNVMELICTLDVPLV